MWCARVRSDEEGKRRQAGAPDPPGMLGGEGVAPGRGVLRASFPRLFAPATGAVAGSVHRATPARGRSSVPVQRMRVRGERARRSRSSEPDSGFGSSRGFLPFTVRKPRHGIAKSLAQGHPPSKWQDRIHSWSVCLSVVKYWLPRRGCFLLGQPRVLRPAKSTGSPWRPRLPPSPWVLALAEDTGSPSSPLHPPHPRPNFARGGGTPSSPALLASGRLPCPPTLEELTHSLLLDRVSSTLAKNILRGIMSFVPVTISPPEVARSPGSAQPQNPTSWVAWGKHIHTRTQFLFLQFCFRRRGPRFIQHGH